MRELWNDSLDARPVSAERLWHGAGGIRLATI